MYSRYSCVSCDLKKKREAHQKNPHAYNMRRNAQKYGLTLPEYANLLERGKCDVCGDPPTGSRHESILHVDHDHRTGLVRGILCGRCNRALGLLRESPVIMEQMIRYLASWKTATSVLE